MFTEKDLQILKLLISLMANKVRFDNLDAKDVNSAYHIFEFLNGLEDKMRNVRSLELELEDLKELCEKLQEEIDNMEEVEEEEKKPTRRRKKKV